MPRASVDINPALVDGSHRSSAKHRFAVVQPGQDETAAFQRLRELGCESIYKASQVVHATVMQHAYATYGHVGYAKFGYAT